MNNQEIIELNKKRVKVYTKELLQQIKQGDLASLSKAKIFEGGKQVKLEDINFNQSLIFIGNQDLLAALGYFGVLKLNNVIVPDTTPTGLHSRIRTQFMTVNSPDIRFSKIEINEGYGYEEIDMPESYKPINYMKKDLILWRLRQDVGLGENYKMYRLCNQWIRDRYAMNKLDWLFFLGTEEEFLNTYGSDLELNIPIYHINSKSGSIPSVSKGTGIYRTGD